MKYLVQKKYDDGSMGARIMTENEIIRDVSMVDCTNEEIEVFDISVFGEVKRLEVRGCWHDMKDPLKICIVSGDKIIFTGYGEDH